MLAQVGEVVNDTGAIIGGGVTIGLSLLGVAWKLGGLSNAVKSLEKRVDNWETRRHIYKGDN